MPSNREIEVIIEVRRQQGGTYSWRQLGGPKLRITDMASCKGCGHKTFPEAFHSCGSCIWCCQCRLCLLCHKFISSTTSACARCKACEDCCQCIKCPACSNGITLENLCSICGNGKSCGCCHYNYGVHYVNRKIQFDRFTGKPVIDMPSKRLVSAEIEVGPMTLIGMQHISVDAALCDWHCSVVGDGSLPSGGFEINTHPASGSKWVQLIKEVCGALNKQQTSVTTQCGCHTHVDARDFSWSDMTKLVAMMGCLELGIYSCLPITRATNRFCTLGAHNYLIHLHTKVFKDLPITKWHLRETTAKTRQAILDILYSPGIKQGDVDQMKRGKGAGNRYRGFNLHSWLFRGTIEYRFPAGTTHATTIINWAAILAILMDKAKSIEWVELMEILQPMYTTMVTTEPSQKFASYNQILIKESQRLLCSFMPEHLQEWLNSRYARFSVRGQQHENC